ncbi:flavin-dependent dehydrogenase [Actinokineospora baliensis]|uniref:NAD(P)/FAD-dependent oxidoreductase n=1 Tax=Actinokineospora baliensis TaxID=547056 RepID=UPI0027DEA370|nr:NAD(P)/FAD-dependent oxidoreductase [Actinokineospora baliensis]MBM7774794.1 flavin-dependent dehydrogenase [Actinokineospora baliensis]
MDLALYDVIIVGARVAGAPTAMLLAKHGHRVLVLDRGSFPSDAVSTHYIHQAGLVQLQKWGLLDEVVAAGTPAIRLMNYRHGDIDLIGFADPIEGIDAVYCPRRTVLDEILVNAARRAGAEVVEQFTVTDLVFGESGEVLGVRGREGDGEVRELRARLVIGADGTHSQVAKRVGAELYNVRPAAGFIYYSYFSGVDDWGLHHKTGFNHRWFGSWPTNDGVTMVATICALDQLKDFRSDPETAFQAVIDDVEPAMGAQFRDAARRAEPLRPMRYPDNYYRRAHGPGWALVGDAGYHKDPITGWGITDAFLHAELLADRAHEGLAGERAMADALEEYVKIRDEISAGVYDFTTVMASMELPPFFDAVLRAIGKTPHWTNKMLGLIAGGVEDHEIFSPDNLERIYQDAGFPEDKRIYDPSA